MYNENELEFKVKSMMLLGQVREEMVNHLNLTIPLQYIEPELIKEIKEKLLVKKGKVNLHFKIIDQEENLGINLFSRTERIDLSNEVIKYLNQKSEIQYSIN